MESPEYAAAYNAYKPKSNRHVCTHCGKQGHVVQKCYRIIGFPLGYKTTGSSSFQNKQYNRSSSGQYTGQQKATNNAVSTTSGVLSLTLLRGMLQLWISSCLS